MAGILENFATNVDGAGTNLRWLRYVPIVGGPTWPAAIVIHGGRWKQMTPGPTNVATDLQINGFLALAVEYRLAPPHTDMPGQVDPPSDGRPPQQVNDIQTAIRAARAHSQCNGKVVTLGFSSGGDHALWWNIAGTNNDDRPDAVVGCSGIYDLDNADMLAGPNRDEVENYINHTIGEGAAFHTAAQAASPYWLSIGTTPKGTLLFNSSAEEIPVSELTTMVTKLTDAGATIENHVITGSAHGSTYWGSAYGVGQDFPTVRACSIDFLNRMLSQSPVTPTGPATITFSRR